MEFNKRLFGILLVALLLVCGGVYKLMTTAVTDFSPAAPTMTPRFQVTAPVSVDDILAVAAGTRPGISPVSAAMAGGGQPVGGGLPAIAAGSGTNLICRYVGTTTNNLLVGRSPSGAGVVVDVDKSSFLCSLSP